MLISSQKGTGISIGDIVRVIMICRALFDKCSCCSCVYINYSACECRHGNMPCLIIVLVLAVR